MAAVAAKPDPELIPLHRVLVEELDRQQPGAITLAEIEAARAGWEARFAIPGLSDDERARGVESALAGEFYRRLHERRIDRSALCLSGGGIRSATSASASSRASRGPGCSNRSTSSRPSRAAATWAAGCRPGSTAKEAPAACPTSRHISPASRPTSRTSRRSPRCGRSPIPSTICGNTAAT